ncbi:transposase [Thioalkalivibrio nitratireducens]|uniref:transposase n=1 Tax=Thioalkalivibrio nitratireducens TaxID=186931 RepID=UPI0006949080|nr:transposase [Thioalkalivibrio nitratireducens]
MARTGETQISRTDPDARRLSKNGQKVTGYNVQSVVDDQHHLILTHEVTNAGNDLGQLVPMAEQARQMLLDGQTTEAAQPLEVLADAGYFTESDIAACASRGIVPYVPVPEKTGAAERAGRLSAREFVYDAEQDRYRCPGGEALHPYGQPDTRNGVNYRRYRSRASVCQSCPLKAQCLPPAGKRREILRSEHAEAVERHRERMAAAPQVMRQRAALCEHPFGTLKRWLGWDHFLVRGFDKVRGEMAMIVHSYNFRRVLSILGLRPSSPTARRGALRAAFLRLGTGSSSASASRSGVAMTRGPWPGPLAARTVHARLRSSQCVSRLLPSIGAHSFTVSALFRPTGHPGRDADSFTLCSASARAGVFWPGVRPRRA